MITNVTAAVCAARGVNPAHIRDKLRPAIREARTVAVFCCRVYLGSTIDELRQAFGLSMSSVYRHIRRANAMARGGVRARRLIKAGESAAREATEPRVAAAE